MSTLNLVKKLSKAMKIFRLRRARKSDWEDINKLIPQLSASAGILSFRDFKKILGNNSTYFFVYRRETRIVGMGLVVFVLTPVGLRAKIEDVVVDLEFRGQGFGSLLMRRLIVEAKKRKALWVEFTSRKDRVLANNFYKKLGFRPRNVNIYRLSFRHGL